MTNNKLRYRIVHHNTSLEAREGEFLVGRSPECHLVLDDPSVSRVHCAIIIENGMIYGEDRGSRNGVIVNGDRIEGRERLTDGDEITLGRQKIRIVSIASDKQNEHTQGLNRCRSCGSWLPAASTDCQSCGATLRRRSRGTLALKKTQGGYPEPKKMFARDKRGSSVIERHPIVMLTELALKALKVRKADEAVRMIGNAVSSANDRIDREGKISDEEFNAVVGALLTLAEEEKSARAISDLFAFHMRARRLLSRDHVQKLYDIVRPTGYRMCSNMTRYLAYLDANEKRLSAGERFISKRVKGLVKLCS